MYYPFFNYSLLKCRKVERIDRETKQSATKKHLSFVSQLVIDIDIDDWTEPETEKELFITYLTYETCYGATDDRILLMI